MLKITGTVNEIDVVGEIFNSVLDMLGGDINSDGFGHYKLTSKRQKNMSLTNVNGDDIKETLEVIKDAIRLSYEKGGAFSKKENWLENYRSR